MSVRKILLVIVRFQIHRLQKILFLFFPLQLGFFPPKTESARRGLACAPRYSLAERAQAVPGVTKTTHGSNCI